jgi:hypothetical protein
MTFKEGLIRARSHIIFILGLIVAFGLVISLERWNIEQSIREGVKIETSHDIPKVTPRPLSADEGKWARIAWRYFEKNFQPETGMVNSVDQYHASTMWDTASYLMALISARRLGIIDQGKFDARLSQILRTLARIPLFEGKLPNKSYNTVRGEMVDYQNRKTEKGIGWSAIDIGRLLVPFNIIVWNYPDHAEEIKAIVKRWKFKAMINDGLFYGAAVNNKGETVLLQEGRIGYEEYASKSLSLMGMDA